MMLRRLAALVTAITLFHGSVAAGASVCPPPAAGGHAAAASGHDAAPMSDHVMAMSHDVRADVGSSTARIDTPPCEMPLQHHCCDLVAGCGSAVVAAAARRDLASDPPVASRIRESLHDVPASFAPAPEPPPPKA
jgi:hypothetical protein